MACVQLMNAPMFVAGRGDVHRNNSTLDYLALLNQLYSLLPLVEAFATLECTSGIPHADGHVHLHDDVTHDMVQLRDIMEVQNVLTRPYVATVSYAATCLPSGSGVLAWIAAQARVRCAATAQALQNCLSHSSLSQMRLARELSVAALQLSVRPSNCLALLQASNMAGLTGLEMAARRCALLHFKEAVECDTAQLFSLTAEQLVSLLSDDALNVSCEGDVFMHLMAWCQAQRQAQGIPMDVAQDHGAVDVKARTTLEMISHMCVRVEHMTLVELEALDACEEVSKDESALKLVAGWYISCIFGSRDVTRNRRVPAVTVTEESQQ